MHLKICTGKEQKNMKNDDKTRLCLSLPTPLYERLNSDSMEYGIAKSSIISMLLVEYYKGNIEIGAGGKLAE